MTLKIVLLDPACLTWQYTNSLAEKLSELDADITVVASEYPFYFHTEDIRYVIDVHFYRLFRRFGSHIRNRTLSRIFKGLEHVFDMFRLIPSIREIDPDLLHYQQSPLPIVDYIFVKYMSRKYSMVHTIHNTTPFHGDGTFIQRLGHASFANLFHKTVVHTEYSFGELVRSGRHSGSDISVIPAGKYNFGVSEKNKYIGRKDPKAVAEILYFGHISYYKGVDILIEAFGHLIADYGEIARLIICGNPQISTVPLIDLAREAGVEHLVEWTLRYIEDDEVDAVFASATIVAMPYRQIDRSAALATVVQYGIPILATRIGGFEEILEDGVHGRLVPVDDVGAMAKAMYDMLTSDEALEKMSAEIELLSNRWTTWGQTAEKTYSLYAGLLDDSV